MTPSMVGVVVPSYGPLDDVAAMLNGLVGPHVPADERPGRVVVVDDCFPGPVDASVLPDGVELIRRERNGGFGAAVNTGLKRLEGASEHDRVGGAGSDTHRREERGAPDAHGDERGTAKDDREGDTGRDQHYREDATTVAPRIEYALVVNSDVRLPELFLRDLLTSASPWLPAVVGCRSEDESGRSGYAARLFPTVGQQVVEWLVPLASLRHTDVLHRAVGHDLAAERASGVVPVEWVSGALMLLPLAEVAAVGRFDESYFMYTEEVDLQGKLRAAGVPAVYAAHLRVTHAGGGSAGSEARRRGWLTNARDLYARRHLNPWALRAGLAGATLVNLAWNTGRRAAGRDVHPVQTAAFEWGLLRAARRFRGADGAGWGAS
ncbi:MAG: glycosyltransferase [Dermabacter sp.]|nr:glycosyltransferase [Dermabacter sp.]